MKALILNEKVVDTAENAFEVAEPLYWMDAPAGCDTTWILKDGILTAPASDPEKTYFEKRSREYPDLGEQLDYIYHNGIAKWKSDMIKPVKDKYPKG